MSHSPIALAALAAAGLSLAGCNVRDSDAANNATTAADNAAPSGIAMTNVAEPAPPPTAVPAAAIATQPGSNGVSVSLTRLAVTGDIMTATFSCTSAEAYNSEQFKIDEVSVIDDATSQRISVLKDNAGTPLASPLGNSKKEIAADCGSKGGVIWAKFPAPPATSKTVSLTLPGVAPFDGIAVTR